MEPTDTRAKTSERKTCRTCLYLTGHYRKSPRVTWSCVLSRKPVSPSMFACAYYEEKAASHVVRGN